MKILLTSCLVAFTVFATGCQQLPTLPPGVVGVNVTYTIATPKVEEPVVTTVEVTQ